jgi:hypothetical protein
MEPGASSTDRHGEGQVFECLLRVVEREEFRRQIEEYRRLVADPGTSPEDRAWYEDLLRGIN